MNNGIYRQAAKDYLELMGIFEKIEDKSYGNVKRYFYDCGLGVEISFMFRIDFRSISLYLSNERGQAKLKETFIIWNGYQAIYEMTLQKCLSYVS